MKYDKRLDEPLNANERYLYEMNVRLGILIEMFSSFLEVYAKQNEVATTDNTVQIKEEEVMEEVKPKRKRTTKKVGE